MRDIPLLPCPKHIRPSKGYWAIPRRGIIFLESDDRGRTSVLHAAKKLCRILNPRKSGWTVVFGPAKRASVSAQISLKIGDHPAAGQYHGYTVDITAAGACASATDVDGLLCAVQTLCQLARWNQNRWPRMTIRDWPNFFHRGYYLDVSRGKVPKRAELLAMVERLAEWKINEFQLYVENVFEFKNHADMYADTTPLTAADIKAVDRACRRNGIDFVPSLTSLGHFDKILRLPRYRHLAEVEPEQLRSQGIKTWSQDPWTLCPTDPAAKALIADMYNQYLPNFTSGQFNICCDESWDLGLGRSRSRGARPFSPLAEKKRIGGLYIRWVNYCAELARQRWKTIQLWGDIIFNHPELIAKLPRDAVLLEWGYAADHPFDDHGKLFAECGRKFYVCPGTSTWQSIGGRTDNALKNIRAAAIAGTRHLASGLLLTDWGDYGHQQLPAVSLLPLAYGAAVAWNAEQKPDTAFCKLLGRILPLDPQGQWVKISADLGNVYQRISKSPLPNSSLDWQLFREPWEKTEFLQMVKPPALAREISRIGRHITALAAMRQMARKATQLPPPLRLVDSPALDELYLTARLIEHTLCRTKLRIALLPLNPAVPNSPDAADRAMARQLLSDIKELQKLYRDMWLRRNKRSRLDDVLHYFHQLAAEYRKLV